jgi:hypothetical protein
MSGFIPATGILPAVLGTRIVLGEAAERADVLAERQSSGGAEVFGFLLPFTGFALMVYLAIIVGLIVTGFALRRRGSRPTTVEA